MKRQEAMGESGGNVYRLVILGRKNKTKPPPKGRALGPEVDDYVPNGTRKDPNQLALGVVACLVMKAPKNSSATHANIVLDKDLASPVLSKLRLPKDFGEGPTRVEMNP